VSRSRHLEAAPIHSIPSLQSEFLVVCLCADWCDTCREYQPGFQALGQQFPNADFLWVDIEDQAAWVNEFEVDDFPTILIQREQWVLFYGTMLPHHGHLQRMLGVFNEQTREESRDYALGSEERRFWQEKYNLRNALRALSGR